MTLFRSVGAIAGASGDGRIDWDAAVDAAIESTAPGSLDVGSDERAAYATAVEDAGASVRAATGLEFQPPDGLDLLNRHHWIECNADTFGELLKPLEDRPGRFGDLARRVNTATMATTLSVLSRYVQGQYNPFGDDSASLTVVRPNVERTARKLDLETERFRRWVVLHEMVHVAQFGAAPWLADRIESQLELALERFAAGEVSRDAIGELDATMTVIEGHAESIVARTFEDGPAEVRRRIAARRRQRGPIAMVIERVFGLRRKRRQYEKGKAFFDVVHEQRGRDGTAAVWDAPDAMPTRAELDDPASWLERVDP